MPAPSVVADYIEQSSFHPVESCKCSKFASGRGCFRRRSALTSPALREFSQTTRVGGQGRALLIPPDRPPKLTCVRWSQRRCRCSSMVEHGFRKAGVVGSSPTIGFLSIHPAEASRAEAGRRADRPAIASALGETPTHRCRLWRLSRRSSSVWTVAAPSWRANRCSPSHRLQGTSTSIAPFRSTCRGEGPSGRSSSCGWTTRNCSCGGDVARPLWQIRLAI